jgi:hypothetical protein
LEELTTQARTTFYGIVPLSAWLVTREWCNYTHLAREHSTTIRKSSPKSVRFFLGPRTYIKIHKDMVFIEYLILIKHYVFNSGPLGLL